MTDHHRPVIPLLSAFNSNPASIQCGIPSRRQRNAMFLCLMQLVATQLAFSVGQPSTRQRNAIRMAFRWRADGGPLLDVYWEINSINTLLYAKCSHMSRKDFRGQNLKKKCPGLGQFFFKIVPYTLSRNKLFASRSGDKFSNFMYSNSGSKIKIFKNFQFIRVWDNLLTHARIFIPTVRLSRFFIGLSFCVLDLFFCCCFVGLLLFL